MSQVLAGQACLSSPLEGDQKIKYDNIKLISIVVSCPSEIQYLELYSFLVKPLTNLTLILYLFSYMQFSFWLCNFFFVLAQIHWQEVPVAERSLPGSLNFTKKQLVCSICVTFHHISKTSGCFQSSFVQQSNKTAPKCSWLLQFCHIEVLWKLLVTFPF